MLAEPLRIILRGGDADCAVCAISMITGVSYADTVREVLRHDAKGGAEGLTDRVIRRTMTGLNHPVRWTKYWNEDSHYGLLDFPDHIVVLKEGQVVEPTATWCGIWNLDDFVAHAGVQPLGIYLVKT